MERCGRCEAEGRKSEIKGLVYHLVGPNGIKLTLCNLCYTVFKDEVGMGEDIIQGPYEDEED